MRNTFGIESNAIDTHTEEKLFSPAQPDPKAAAMKQSLSTILVLALVALISQPSAAQQAQPSPTPGGRGGGSGGAPPPIQAKPEELAKIKEKTEQIEALVKDLKAKRANSELVGDVEVHGHAGKMLLEYPDIVKVKPRAAVPEMLTAGLFDEHWQLTK
jgi:hypothetical protein